MCTLAAVEAGAGRRRKGGLQRRFAFRSLPLTRQGFEGGGRQNVEVSRNTSALSQALRVGAGGEDGHATRATRNVLTSATGRPTHCVVRCAVSDMNWCI